MSSLGQVQLGGRKRSCKKRRHKRTCRKRATCKWVKRSARSKGHCRRKKKSHRRSHSVATDAEDMRNMVADVAQT